VVAGSSSTVFINEFRCGGLFDDGTTDCIDRRSRSGIAPVVAADEVVHFLSFSGTIEALDGQALGANSTDIGVSPPNATPDNQSLQLIGSSTLAEDFSWQPSASSTFGKANNNQTLIDQIPEASPNLVTVLDEDFERNCGDQQFTTSSVGFSNGGDVFSGRAWDFDGAFGNLASPLPEQQIDVSDFADGFSFTGCVTFADGQENANVTARDQGDTDVEPHEPLIASLIPVSDGSIATSSETAPDSRAFATIQTTTRRPQL
jgi:hypothetical protein